MITRRLRLKHLIQYQPATSKGPFNPSAHCSILLSVHRSPSALKFYITNEMSVITDFKRQISEMNACRSSRWVSVNHGSGCGHRVVTQVNPSFRTGRVPIDQQCLIAFGDASLTVINN